MSPALIGLLAREHNAHTQASAPAADQGFSSTPAPAPATPLSASEEGTVADLAYLASLPLRG